MKTIRVASRQSALAMTQTQWVIAQLKSAKPGLAVEVVPVVTKGDKIVDVALSKVGGKGLFVSEIEEHLLRGEADFAVHSLKDVPAELATGLEVTAIPKREDARDALISADGKGLFDLPTGARVGTSSLRRIAQLKRARPDLDFVPIRGNIDTRLKKLETEGLHAIVLAAAGLHRMGWADRITQYLDPEVCLPAIGQGILGIEGRAGDDEVRSVLLAIHDAATEQIAVAERTLLKELNGGCQVPIGGFAQAQADGLLHVTGLVASVDGSQVLRATAAGTNPQAVGLAVADELRRLGADGILEVTASVIQG